MTAFAIVLPEPSTTLAARMAFGAASAGVDAIASTHHSTGMPPRHEAKPCFVFHEQAFDSSSFGSGHHAYLALSSDVGRRHTTDRTPRRPVGTKPDLVLPVRTGLRVFAAAITRISLSLLTIDRRSRAPGPRGRARARADRS